MEDVRIGVHLMGGDVEFVIYNSHKESARGLIEDAIDECRVLEKIFNFYDEKSELSMLNKKRTMKVSDKLLYVIETALKYCEISEGAYDISLGKKFIARKEGTKMPKVFCSYNDIKIEKNKVTLMHPDALIDLGSIAKGFIGDEVIAFLKKGGAKSGLIDARGDIRVYGEVSEEIVIQDPRDKSRTFAPFTLKDSAVATSGDYHQFKGSFAESHIVGKKEYASVTVVSPTLIVADALATTVAVCSKDQVKKLSRLSPESRILAVDDLGKIDSFRWFKNSKK